MRSEIQLMPATSAKTMVPLRPVHSADEIWFSRYNFRRRLGEGGMGAVYLADDKQNHDHPCVVKQLVPKFNNAAEQTEAVRLFKREAEILATLHHPGIVPILDSHITADNQYYLVMDYIPGTNLNLMLSTTGPMSQNLAVGLMIQCLEILEYLHTQNPPIIYRDLKPSNIMLTPEGRIVLIDFGIARLLMPQQPATRVVSEGYSPPEQYAGKPEPASDLYALGCTLSQLLTGVRPRPLTVCSPAQHNADVLPEVDALCRQLTTADLRERPSSAREVRLALYKIYLKANPETEILADLLKGIPLRKPGQSNHIISHNASLHKAKSSHQAASGFSAAVDSVLHARQYFQQIWHERSAVRRPAD